MYTKGDILEEPYGWGIEIMDPAGDTVVVLKYPMTPDERYSSHVEEILNSQADGLLSHLNR